MPAPRHARIGFYTARPGDLDHVIERARDEVIPMLELEAGFRRYTIVRTGPDVLASITGWDTHEEAQMAGRRLSAWVAEVIGETLVSVENHIAEVAHITESSPAAPTYGRIAAFQFKPGVAEGLQEKVEAEFVPLLRQQPGFVRYVVFRTGPESVITFTAFASRGEGEAAAEAIREWMERNVAEEIASVERHAGAVVWSIRTDGDTPGVDAGREWG
ncbi:MAG: antibiotic biosynthesis monooxygenase [Thermomicrobiales bacterium]